MQRGVCLTPHNTTSCPLPSLPAPPHLGLLPWIYNLLIFKVEKLIIKFFSQLYSWSRIKISCYCYCIVPKGKRIWSGNRRQMHLIAQWNILLLGPGKSPFKNTLSPHRQSDQCTGPSASYITGTGDSLVLEHGTTKFWSFPALGAVMNSGRDDTELLTTEGQGSQSKACWGRQRPCQSWDWSLKIH